MILAIFGAITVLVARIMGNIQVPGYAATVVTVLLFGGLTSLGLGIVGQIHGSVCRTRAAARHSLCAIYRRAKPKPNKPATLQTKAPSTGCRARAAWFSRSGT